MTTEDSPNDQTGWIGWLRARIAGAGRRLHEAQRGATLTEFIVVLPVFITVFVAILRFGNLQSTTVQLQMSATKGLWDKAIPVQKQVAPGRRYTHPNDAAGASVANVNRPNKSRQFSDPIDEDMAEGIRRGTTGEAAAAVDDSGADNYADLSGLPPSVNGTIEPRTHDVVERQDFNSYEHNPTYAELVADDRQGRADAGPPKAPSPLDNMNLMPSNTNRETNAAYAAGTRYGLVQVDKTPPASAVADIPGVNAADLHVGYNTLVAPYPMVHHFNDQHYRPVGTARRLMEQKRLYRDLYGIDYGR